MSKTREILNYFGICAVEADDNQLNDQSISYIARTGVGAEEKLKLHRDFLKAIEAEENGRLTLLENKTTQLVSQTGIIFALLSLFIPLVIDKIDIFYLKSLLLGTLLLAFLFYLLTIYNAAKNFNVIKFVYSKSSITNVIKYKDDTAEQFLTVEINDLLYAAKQNSKTNDVKATNLICSYNSFKVANILTAILGILLCLSLFFTKQKKDPITIENPIRIENCAPIANQPQS